MFSLLSESKPQASQASQAPQPESFSENFNYNENYNYAYQSIDSADELMVIEEKFDGDNNNIVNGRLGAALPSVPFAETLSSLECDPYR